MQLSRDICKKSTTVVGTAMLRMRRDRIMAALLTDAVRTAMADHKL